jgi:hypothetical protein
MITVREKWGILIKRVFGFHDPLEELWLSSVYTFKEQGACNKVENKDNTPYG